MQVLADGVHQGGCSSSTSKSSAASFTRRASARMCGGHGGGGAPGSRRNCASGGSSGGGSGRNSAASGRSYASAARSASRSVRYSTPSSAACNFQIRTPRRCAASEASNQSTRAPSAARPARCGRRSTWPRPDPTDAVRPQNAVRHVPRSEGSLCPRRALLTVCGAEGQCARRRAADTYTAAWPRNTALLCQRCPVPPPGLRGPSRRLLRPSGPIITPHMCGFDPPSKANSAYTRTTGMPPVGLVYHRR
jgi:hypothetical protein